MLPTLFKAMNLMLFTLFVTFQEDISKPLIVEDVDNANGTVYLHYDPDNNVVFTIGKVGQF